MGKEEVIATVTIEYPSGLTLAPIRIRLREMHSDFNIVAVTPPDGVAALRDYVEYQHSGEVAIRLVGELVRADTEAPAPNG